MTTIHLAQKDIDNGDGGPYSGYCCPVAIAINRELPSHRRAYVVPYGGIDCDEDDLGIFIENIFGDKWKDRVRIEPPEEVVTFTEDFDEWEGFQCLNDDEKSEWRKDRWVDYDPDPVYPLEFELELTTEPE